MINANDKVRLIGRVSEVGTGTFKASVEEIFVDGEWKKFSEAKVLDIDTSADYSNDSLTAQELAFVKGLAEKQVGNNTLVQDDLMLAKSIFKKLGGTAE